MNMVEVRVEELSGAALDWAVAMAEKMPVTLCRGPGNTWVNYFGNDFDPSRSWDCCGWLIEKYKICISFEQGDEVYAVYSVTGMNGQTGGTPLIAACRAIVAAKLGPTVSIPAELVTA